MRREEILYKCSDFLRELREILLELNFKGLKVVSYRCLQTFIKFVSFFLSTWTISQSQRRFIAILQDASFVTSNKMLADSLRNWVMFVTFPCSFRLRLFNFPKTCCPISKTFQPNISTNVRQGLVCFQFWTYLCFVLHLKTRFRKFPFNTVYRRVK